VRVILNSSLLLILWPGKFFDRPYFPFFLRIIYVTIHFSILQVPQKDARKKRGSFYLSEYSVGYPLRMSQTTFDQKRKICAKYRKLIGKSVIKMTGSTSTFGNHRESRLSLKLLWI